MTMTVLFVLLKILVTVAIVVGLSVVAEHVSPRVAGVLSGYPLGAAIALFFIGLEIGPAFAAESAVYTIAGLVGSLSFVYAYYQTALRCDRWAIPVASTGAMTGYFAVIGLLHSIDLSKVSAVLFTVCATVAFAFIFRNIEDSRIDRPVRLTFRILVLRAVLAAIIILMITGAAKWVGSRWAGLFSAFPTTLFPLMLIVHISYGRAPVNTIIKNFPRGLGSLILYALGVSFVYPRYGVLLGTIVAFTLATAYLVAYGTVVAKAGK